MIHNLQFSTEVNVFGCSHVSGFVEIALLNTGTHTYNHVLRKTRLKKYIFCSKWKKSFIYEVQFLAKLNLVTEMPSISVK